ncbi:MAG: ABC transporter permease subunit [Eubacteriales bacterium]|nr:ABC transporter permease subunit [Eubacteriales bacterium]
MSRKKEYLSSFVVKFIALACILIVWELASKGQIFGPKTQILLPSLESIVVAFIDNFKIGYAGMSMWVYVGNSMKLLLIGLLLGTVLSLILSGLSIISKKCYYVYDMLVSVFDLLPGVALLPVVIIIFGINSGVIVFLVVHSVIWPLSRNILDGFFSVPKLYVEAGTNIGLRGFGLLTGVYLPASMNYIVSGFKVAWARAWRGLISAEMIFGIATCPGIGLYINQMRNNMNNAEMYATLIVIIIIGMIVQYGFINPIEKNTVKKWGMTK